MEILVAALAVALLASLGGIALILSRQKPASDPKDALLFQQQMSDLRRALDERLADTNKLLHAQQSETAKLLQGQGKQNSEGLSKGLEEFRKNSESANRVAQDASKKIAEVTEKLAKLEETNRQVLSVSEQLGKLESVLTNPKHRGVLGEYYLDTVLGNMFAPNQYELQYKFPNGEAVDAAIFLRDKTIPIDSKFSLENYNRILEAKEPAEREKYEKAFKADLKNRIDETSKYIRPQDGTTDFAFMFIPSEGVYYDLLVNKVGAAKVNASDLIEYAFRQKKVIIVSPTSFYAYLQTVAQGMKLLQVEESAKEIRAKVQDLGRHLSAYEDFMRKLGNTLSTTVNHYNAAAGEFRKIDKDVLRITDGAAGGQADLPKLDRPQAENE